MKKLILFISILFIAISCKKVKQEPIPREMLYLADEIFLTGTAAEVTPIRSVDRIKIGNGKRGEITEKLQTKFFNIVEGIDDDKHGWLTFIE